MVTVTSEINAVGSSITAVPGPDLNDHVRFPILGTPIEIVDDRPQTCLSGSGIEKTCVAKSTLILSELSQAPFVTVQVNS